MFRKQSKQENKPESLGEVENETTYDKTRKYFNFLTFFFYFIHEKQKTPFNTFVQSRCVWKYKKALSLRS